MNLSPFLTFFYSQQCCVCSKVDSYAERFGVCRSCLRDRHQEQKQYQKIHSCQQCGQHLTEEESDCPYCSSRFVFFDEIISLRVRTKMEHLLLQRNKFELHEVLCRYFALDTLGKLRRLRQRPDRIVFLPSQDTKIGRFYHPASQLASRLARKWNIPLQSPLRKVSDEKQSGKSFYERFLHAKKAFRFRKKDSSWKGLHILIVDDIFTTGASLNEVARLFRLSGARRVTCLVILNNEGD